MFQSESTRNMKAITHQPLIMVLRFSLLVIVRDELELLDRLRAISEPLAVQFQSRHGTLLSDPPNQQRESMGAMFKLNIEML